jgi:hypothetical protein
MKSERTNSRRHRAETPTPDICGDCSVAQSHDGLPNTPKGLLSTTVTLKPVLKSAKAMEKDIYCDIIRQRPQQDKYSSVVLQLNHGTPYQWNTTQQ